MLSVFIEKVYCKKFTVILLHLSMCNKVLNKYKEGLMVFTKHERGSFLGQAGHVQQVHLALSAQRHLQHVVFLQQRVSYCTAFDKKKTYKVCIFVGLRSISCVC